MPREIIGKGPICRGSPTAAPTTRPASSRAAHRCVIDEQIRNVARAMTPAEIDDAARYYAEHP
jgi:hypothetical protein